MRAWTMDSGPVRFLWGLTPTRAVIAGGIGLMAFGIALLVLTTLAVIAANVSPLRPLYVGGGALALVAEGFGITILSTEFVE